MNINQDNITSSKESLELPGSNLDNITLSHNLLATPIIRDLLKDFGVKPFKRRYTLSNDKATITQHNIKQIERLISFYSHQSLLF